MSNRLRELANRRSGQPSPPASSAASTGPADPSLTHRRLRESFESLLAGADPEAMGSLGMVVKQVLPMLMRRFHAMPEDKLRAGLADMVGKLQLILDPTAAADPPPVVAAEADVLFHMKQAATTWTGDGTPPSGLDPDDFHHHHHRDHPVPDAGDAV